jgi:hypothetical protein
MSIPSVAETQCKKQNAMHKRNNIRHFLLNWAYRLVIGYGIYPSKPYFIIQCPESLQSPGHPHACMSRSKGYRNESKSLEQEAGNEHLYWQSDILTLMID